MDPNAVHTGGKDKEEQKVSFNLVKAKCKNTKADKTGTRNKVTTKTAWQSNNLKARQSTKKKIKVQIKHQKPEIKIQRTHTIREEQGQEQGQEHTENRKQ